MSAVRRYRPVFLDDLDLRLPGLVVHRLRLNQHVPESARWSEHSHAFGQVLVYLSGHGRQSVDGRSHECRAGTVMHLAPGSRHAFERDRARLPVVMVLDVDLTDPPLDTRSATLPANDLARIKDDLSSLLKAGDLDQRERRLRVGSAVLDMLDPVLHALGWLQPREAAARPDAAALVKMVERVLADEKHDAVPLSALARTIGWQQDHLNRLLKSACGLTLGQLRARSRLKRAQTLLRDGASVQEAAGRIGIDDQNYFARWFRQQTGLTPTEWRRSGGDTHQP